jgi:hypothetical protein
MADAIRLKRDPHRITQELLPWYIQGTLDLDEAAVVRAHLQSCAACRAELETDRALSAMMAAAPSEADLGWATLKNRIAGEASPRRGGVGRRSAAPRRRLSALGRAVARPSRGWAAAAQAASLVVIAGSAWIWANQPHAQYHVLSAPKVVNTGNVVVIFKPTMSERDMLAALRSADARLVDGPTVSDAYVLHVADAERASALSKLRANAQVILAEPIGGDSHP